MKQVRARIWRVHGARDADLPLPAAATPGSAGMDLCAAVSEPCVVVPGARAEIPTGFAVALPEGYEGQIRPRSGLAREHGITIPNAPGTIDSDYRGEIRILLANLGDAPFSIRRGDRIAQLVIAAVSRPVWEEVESARMLGETERGPGGFGHTGI